MKVHQIKIEFNDRDIITMLFSKSPTKGELVDKLEQGIMAGDRYYETLYTAAINLINKDKKIKNFLYGLDRGIVIEDRTGSVIAKLTREVMEVEENKGV